MAERKTDPLLLHIRKLAEAQRNNLAPDHELLCRYAAEGDQAAFTALVRRHGSMVLRVCRRVLRHDHDAEDVFQATFMVLSRKAGSRRWQASVTNWLYKVAYRLALEEKAAALRRRAREGSLEIREAIDPQSATSLQDAEAMLDEELARLPDILRLPMVLCYLNGQTHHQAAQQVGCSLATIDRRLAKARELLRRRLERRGVALPAALLLGGLTSGATAAESSALLVGPTVRAAVAFAARQGGLEAGISAHAAVLAEGVLQAMVLTKVKLGAVLLAATLMVGTVSALVCQRFGGHVARKASPAGRPATGKILAPAGHKHVAVDSYGDALPDGAVARMGTVRWRHGGYVSHVEYLPDGKRMLTVGHDRMARLWDAITGKPLRSFPVASESAFNFALSRDGNLLAMSGKEPAIYLYDVSSGKRLHKLQIPKSNNNFAALIFTPDSQALVAAASTSTIHVWETATGKEFRQIGGKPFRPGTIIGLGQPISSFRDALAFADDGKTLLWAGCYREGRGRDTKDVLMIRMWDFATGEERHQHKLFSKRFGRGPSVAFSSDGKMLAWVSVSREVRGVVNVMGQPIPTDGPVINLFHVVTGHKIHKILDFDFHAQGLAFSPDSKLVAVRGPQYRQVKVWDVATGKQRGQIDAPTKARRGHGGLRGLPAASSVAFSPDGKILAAGGESSVGLLDVVQGKELYSENGHQWMVSQLHFTPDAKTVLSQSKDETARQWDVKTGKELRRIEGMEDKRTLPVFSRDGRRGAAIVLLPNNTPAWNINLPIGIRVWNTDTGKDIRRISIEAGYYDDPHFLAISPDGKWLALHRRFLFQDKGKHKSWLRSKTWLYDLTKNKGPKYIFSGDSSTKKGNHRGDVGIIFSPDSQLLAVPFPFNDHVLCVWDVATGKQRCQIEVPDKYSIRSMAFTLDGQSLALDLGDDRLSIWDVTTGKERRRMNKKPLPADTHVTLRWWGLPRPTVSQLAFSPDGEVLVEGRVDGTIGIWDAATGEEIGVLRGHQGPVQTVAFASDGKTLASGSMDTTVLLWDMTRWTQRKKMLPRSFGDGDLESQWTGLANPDQTKVYQAVLALAAEPKRAAPFLGKRLHPVAAADAARVQRLIRDLDSDKYAVRTKASKALAQEGEASVPLLRAALKDKTLSLETHKRLQDLLTTLAKWPVTGERLRQLWAVEALELMGTPEAKQVLQTLAKGVSDATLTRAAQAALKRLGR